MRHAKRNMPARFGMDSAGLRTRESALHYAAIYGRVDVVRRLLEVDGIDANAKDKRGYLSLPSFYFILRSYFILASF